MSRTPKTPRQRAEEQLALAERVVDRLDKKWRKAHADAERLNAEHEAAVARRDHLKQHPDLTTNPSPTTTTGDDA